MEHRITQLFTDRESPSPNIVQQLQWQIHNLPARSEVQKIPTLILLSSSCLFTSTTCPTFLVLQSNFRIHAVHLILHVDVYKPEAERQNVDNSLQSFVYRMVEKVGSSVSMPCIAACKAAASDSVPSVMHLKVCLELLTLDEKLDLQCIYYQSNVLINMVICDISALQYIRASYLLLFDVTYTIFTYTFTPPCTFE